MPEPLSSHDLEIRVRYAETDAMGYLHHAQYLVYFEAGRTELLRVNGLRYRDMEQRGLFYVVARVEVRFRASERFGTPAETVGAHKQRRLAATAAHYLQQHRIDAPCRFDVLAIGGGNRIDWIRDAFYAE